MCNEIYGYIRISTKEQNESRQLLALKNHGVPPENIYSDKSRAAISTVRAISDC